MNRQRPGKFPNRHGAVLIAALVCLLIVMAMLGAMLLATLRSARQLHRERDRRQCDFLLQAGEDRAKYRLSSEPNGYRGEVWLLPAASLIDAGEGRVTIEVWRPAGDEHSKITVVAEYPAGSEHSIRRSHTFSATSQPSKDRS